MPIKRFEEITCPSCGHAQRMLVWSTVNAIDPKAVQMVKDMRLNVFQCEQCAHEGFVDESVLYHDMENRYCVQYLSRETAKNPEYYASNLTKRATVVLDPLSQRILEKNGETYLNHPHFVFSTREMVAYIAFRELCAHLGHEVSEDQIPGS